MIVLIFACGYLQCNLRLECSGKNVLCYVDPNIQMQILHTNLHTFSLIGAIHMIP